PIDTHCACQGCSEKIPLKQLWQWFLARDLRASTYTTLHNIQFYADLMREIRQSIERGMFEELREEYSRWY
ncbi:MAG: hypothetical protein Q8P72_04370, partial [Candidatus Roizmanbacteria bacterium]|nr:hypothetical protein [Candidatus Roizmanbacteria bacterium]